VEVRNGQTEGLGRGEVVREREQDTQRQKKWEERKEEETKNTESVDCSVTV
jgi:hypothetical protein